MSESRNDMYQKAASAKGAFDHFRVATTGSNPEFREAPSALKVVSPWSNEQKAHRDMMEKEKERQASQRYGELPGWMKD